MAESGPHHLAHKRLLDLEAGNDGGIPPLKERIGGTPNVNAMRISGWLWWAHRFGSPSDVDPPRKLALAMLSEQESQGHMLGEQCAPRPHDEYWIAPHAALRLVAVERKDKELLAATARWWRNELALCQAGSCPDGEVHLACMRAGNEFGKGGFILSDPAQSAMSAIWRLVNGMKLLAPVTEKSIADPEFLGPRLIKHLLDIDDDLGVEKAAIKRGLHLPFLRVPMKISRWGEGHQAAFQDNLDPSPLNAPVVWINVIYQAPKGRKSSNLVHFGRDWTKGKPDAPKTAQIRETPPRKQVAMSKEEQVPIVGGFAQFLVGCTQTAALVTAGLGGLQKRTFKWDPTKEILGGADYKPSFEARVGVAYDARRSPLEAETLVEPFNRIDQALAVGPLCGLPKGYRLTETDKADLFYVLGPRGTLAIRELVMPEVDMAIGAQVPPEPTIIPPPVAPPPVPPAPTAPAAHSPPH